MEVLEDLMKISADHKSQVLLDEDIDIKLDLINNQPNDGGNNFMTEDISFSLDQNPLDAPTSQIDCGNAMIHNTYSTYKEEVASHIQDEDPIDTESLVSDLGVGKNFPHPDGQELDNVSGSPRNNSQNHQDFHASFTEQERYNQNSGYLTFSTDNTSDQDFDIEARTQNPLKSNFDVKALREAEDLTSIAHESVGTQSLLDNDFVAPEVNSSWSVTAFNEDEANGYLSSSSMEQKKVFKTVKMMNMKMT